MKYDIYNIGQGEAKAWEPAMEGFFVLDGEDGRFFKAPDDFVEWVFGSDALFPPETLPAAYGAEPAGPRLIAIEAIERANSSIDEDLPADALIAVADDAVAELQALMDQWQAKHVPEREWYRPTARISLDAELVKWQVSHPDDVLASAEESEV